MSRVAKMPVMVPTNVEVNIQGQAIEIKGPKGLEKIHAHKLVKITNKDQQLSFEPRNNTTQANALAGTMRALINNSVHGVTQNFTRKLVLVGVGYRAQTQGKKINLVLGFSHPIEFSIPDGIIIETPSNTEIIVKGTNKQRVGQVAADIRAFRPPEPYKGKGIRYSDEIIKLKETKKK